MNLIDQSPDFRNRNFETTTIDRELTKLVTRADSPLYIPYQLRPYNPDDIWRKRGNYDIFDEMREDEQLFTLLALKKMMIIDAEWQVECEDEDIQNFIEWNFKYNLDETFERKLYNMLSAFDFGFSLTEKVFEPRETEKYGYKIVLKELKTRPPHTFEFDQDDYGDIIQVRQRARAGDLIINPKKFIHYVHQKEFDNPYGKSELNLGIYRAWFSKNALIKFYNIYMERFGMPTVVANYEAQYSQQIESLKTILKNIQAKTNIILPKGIELNLLEASTRGRSEFIAALDWYNTVIARKMLIPDLMGFAGSETGGGSFALGKEHFGVFYAIINQIRKQLEMLIDRELVDPLVQANFGTQYEANFKFKQADDYKTERNLRLWIDAVNGGKIPVNDMAINWFLDSIDAPQFTEEELAEIKEQKDALTEQLTKNKPEEPTPDKKPPEQETGKEGLDKQAEKKEEYAAYFRPLTKHEQGVNFAAIENDFDEVQETHLPELESVLKLMINGLVDDIKRRQIVEKKRIDLINKLDIRHKAKLQQAIHAMMRDSFTRGRASVPAREFIIDNPSALDDEDVIEWLRENAVYTSTAEAEEILKKVKGTLLSAIRSGAGTTEVIHMLDEALEGYDITRAGTIDKVSRLETIARTVISKSYNEARMQEFDKTSEYIIGWFLSPILDTRTTDICRALDSHVAGIYKPALKDAINPPEHHNCRSILLPVYADEEVEKWASGIPGNLQKVEGDFFKVKKYTNEDIDINEVLAEQYYNRYNEYGFSVKQKRDKSGRFAGDGHTTKKTADEGDISGGGGGGDYISLQKKNIEHYTKSGSGNPDKYKGLNENQIEIVKSFEAMNDNRSINEISSLSNKGISKNEIIKEYGVDDYKKYENVKNYIDKAPAYNGKIERLIRDDKGIFDSAKAGDTLEFNRLTSFGEEGNEFKIRGGDLKIHIEKNTKGKSIKNLMPFKEEKEVLINNGKYKILKKEVDNFNHIYLEEIS